MSNLPSLMEKAEKIYLTHFSRDIRFERAIFFSWGCTVGDCAFCYMSTQPKNKPPKETKRSIESILAEFVLAKHLGWEIGFFTGGIGVLKPEELEFLLKVGMKITGKKVWLSVGPIPKSLLKRYSPYIKGVVGSIETINPELHRKICPSKPLEPYEKMFVAAKELSLQKAITFIVGMGEKKKDLLLLINFIKKNEINKVHLYGLIPQKGTIFAGKSLPSKEYQAWWIAQLRINFPDLDIQCGIWEDRVERTSFLLKAGANSFSKFQALKLFGTEIARRLEEQAGLAGRNFKGTLTQLPDIDWEKEVNRLSINEELKIKIKEKLKLYLAKINRNLP